MAELISLQRSLVGRQIGSKTDAYAVFGKLLKEKPETKPVFHTNEGELWQIEKQFWLKYKKLFQGMGFLPIDTNNPVTGRPYMLENY